MLDLKSRLLIETKDLTLDETKLLTLGVVNLGELKGNKKIKLALEYVLLKGIGEKLAKILYVKPIKEYSRILSNLLYFMSTSQILPFDFEVGRLVPYKMPRTTPQIMVIGHEGLRKVTPTVYEDEIKSVVKITDISSDALVVILMGINRLTFSLRIAILNQYLSLLLLRLKNDSFDTYLNSIYAILISIIEAYVNTYFKAHAAGKELAYSILHSRLLGSINELSRFPKEKVITFFKLLVDKLGILSPTSTRGVIPFDSLFPPNEPTIIGYLKDKCNFKKFKILFYNNFFRYLIEAIDVKNDKKLIAIRDAFNTFIQNIHYPLLGFTKRFFETISESGIDKKLLETQSKKVKILIPLIITEQTSLAQVLIILEYLNSILKNKKISVNVKFLFYYSPLTYLNKLFLNIKIDSFKKQIKRKFQNIVFNTPSYYVVPGTQIYLSHHIFYTTIKKEVNDNTFVIFPPFGSGAQYIAMKRALNQIKQQ